MISTWKKKHQHKSQLYHLNEILNDSVIGSKTRANAKRHEVLEFQANSRSIEFGSITVGEKISCQDQIIENNIDNKLKMAVKSAVMTLKKWMHDAISTRMDNVVVTRVAVAVRSTTEMSGRGSSSVVQDPHQWDLAKSTGNTPLMSASSRISLNVGQHKNVATRDDESFEVGNFLALRPKNDHRAHANHMVTVHNTSRYFWILHSTNSHSGQLFAPEFYSTAKLGYTVFTG